MIESGETSIIGHWLAIDSGVTGDESCRRIELLVRTYLVQVARSPDGWSTLYRDPGDGRFWEHTYPQSELHGGGPPALQCVSHTQAKALYGVEA